MPTELNDDVNCGSVCRDIDGLVVRVTRKGIWLRGHRKRKALFVSWESVCRFALDQAEIPLNAKQWQNPRETVRNIGKVR